MTKGELADLMLRVFTDELAAAAHFEKVAADLGYGTAIQKRLAILAHQVFSTEIMALREAGQKEYAHDEGNAFANFVRAGEDLGLDSKHVLWIFAMKHRDGIVAWLRGHHSQREDVRGRINDLIVYLFILRGMIDAESLTPEAPSHDAGPTHTAPGTPPRPGPGASGSPPSR